MAQVQEVQSTLHCWRSAASRRRSGSRKPTSSEACTRSVLSPGVTRSLPMPRSRPTPRSRQARWSMPTVKVSSHLQGQQARIWPSFPPHREQMRSSPLGTRKSTMSRHMTRTSAKITLFAAISLLLCGRVPKRSVVAALPQQIILTCKYAGTEQMIL